jgi:hypothetical protein
LRRIFNASIGRRKALFLESLESDLPGRSDGERQQWLEAIRLIVRLTLRQ